MIYPKFLEKGSTIGVPAPSSGAYNDFKKVRFQNAKKRMEEEQNFNVILSKNINVSEKCRSASAKERANEINEMFERPDIDFIACAAGGEFLVEILPYIDFSKIVNNPKFVQGFSDPTGLLFPITTKYDIATIYGNNFSEYGVDTYDRSVFDNLEIIKGNMVKQNNYDMYEDEWTEEITGLEGYNFTDKVVWKSINNLDVNVTGRIIGGCFDIISELAGTKYDGTVNFCEKYKNDGIIWYFDNCELTLEELIRTLWKLNELGYFKYASAVIFGRNGCEKSCLGYTMEEALKDSVIADLNIPILYDADFSHKGPCLTVINGAIASIEYSNGKASLVQKLN